jgi:hypothetical protein
MSENREGDRMPEKFRFRGTGHHMPGDCSIILKFERAEGIPFDMSLSVDDAEILKGALDLQISIAKQSPNTW